MKSVFRIHLESSERTGLLSMVKTGKHKAQSILKAQILLHSDESNGNTPLRKHAISQIFGTSEKNIERTRKSFCEEGMGIFDPKQRKIRCDKKFDARVEAHVQVILCSECPNDEPKWTLQMVADKLVEIKVVESISRMSVCNLQKKMNLNRHSESNM